MTHLSFYSAFVSLTIALVWSPVSISGQTTVEGIVVNGSDSVERPAELMRMSMKIEAKGETFEKALQNLANKKKKAMIALEKLTALEDSIQFGETTSGQQSDTSQMIAQMRRAFGNDPRVANMMKVKPPVVLSVEVTADWKLDSEIQGDDCLLACDALREKISNADVGSAQEADELSEEQQELAEELNEMMSEYSYSSQGEQTAGEASFYYVARLTAEQIDTVTESAISRAKQSASRMAKMANVELGSLKLLTDMSNPYMEMMNIDPYGYGSRQSTPQNKRLPDGSIEVVSQNPLSVKYTASITTSFAIK